MKGVSSGSNLGRWNKNERLRSNRADRRGGAMASAVTVPSLARSGFSIHSAWLWMGIRSKQRGAHGGSHLGQQSSWEVAVVACNGGATPSGSVDDGGWLRCSSGLNKRSGSLATGSSCFPKPSIAVTGGGRRRATTAARVLGLGVLLVKI
jgi:hypothetical protein